MTKVELHHNGKNFSVSIGRKEKTIYRHGLKIKITPFMQSKSSIKIYQKGILISEINVLKY